MTVPVDKKSMPAKSKYRLGKRFSTLFGGRSLIGKNAKAAYTVRTVPTNNARFPLLRSNDGLPTAGMPCTPLEINTTATMNDNMAPVKELSAGTGFGLFVVKPNHVRPSAATMRSAPINNNTVDF